MRTCRTSTLGTPIVRARVGGAAPGTLLTKEDLTLPPTVDEYIRQLVEPSAFLGVSDETGEAPILPDDEPERAEP
jgi:hypothetical protein